ncbi:hypothetical protein JCM33374_g2183 [Metschnikowia sp. JCM 33374]|nr:hypothetical protein JCM33374_g2183 [Metschnikowia sp. JCM 33374]
MSIPLPKQRGKNAFRLSRQDLMQRRSSSHIEGVDFSSAIRSYRPQRFSLEDIPPVPVYDWERNEIRRFSRCASVPQQTPDYRSFEPKTSPTAVAPEIPPVLPPAPPTLSPAPPSASAREISSRPEVVHHLQPLQPTTNLVMHEKSTPIPSIAPITPIQSITIKQQSFKSEATPKPPLPSLLELNNIPHLSPVGFSRVHEWISPRPPSQVVEAPSFRGTWANANPSIKSTNFDGSQDTTLVSEISEESSEAHERLYAAFTREFTTFCDSYQPQCRPLTISAPRSVATPQHAPEVAEPEEVEIIDTSFSDTSSVSQASAFDSYCSVDTVASTETDLSSVEMFDSDIMSYYEKTYDVPSVYSETSRYSDPSEYSEISRYTDARMNPYPQQEEIPPPPPKHQWGPTNRALLTSKSNPGVLPYPRVPKIDFCLDLGADYDKSRFMIPAEHQVAKRILNKSPASKKSGIAGY